MPNEPAHPPPFDAPAPPLPLRVAFLGYGDAAREQALRLKALPSHWRVDVVVRPGGMSWIRAMADGFRPVPPSEAAARADVVAVHLPEREQPGVWAYSVEPYLAPGALVVFARGSALYAGSVDPGSDLDVALVRQTAPANPASPASGDVRCRVAVHRDATGRALERSAAFARAVFGATSVGTTTLDAEVRADIAALVENMGGLPALLAEWDRLLADPGHEPDQATLGYYERLRAAVTAGVTGGRDRRGADSVEPQGVSSTKRALRWKVDLSRSVVSKKRGAA
jgi:ketol-acid reductoisomerase